MSAPARKTWADMLKLNAKRRESGQDRSIEPPREPQRSLSSSSPVLSVPVRRESPENSNATPKAKTKKPKQTTTAAAVVPPQQAAKKKRPTLTVADFLVVASPPAAKRAPAPWVEPAPAPVVPARPGASNDVVVVRNPNPAARERELVVRRRHSTKKKRPTKLKQTILADRRQKYLSYLLERQKAGIGGSIPKSAAEQDELIKTALEEGLSSSDAMRLVNDLAAVPISEDDIQQTLATGVDPADAPVPVADAAPAVAAPDNDALSRNKIWTAPVAVEANADDRERLIGSLSSTEKAMVTNGKPPKLPNLHTPIREYCNQAITPELNQAVTALLTKLRTFYERARAVNEQKAKSKRRVITGLREVLRAVQRNKVKCVIVAPNIDEVAGPGGLDDLLNEIQKSCRSKQIPLVYALKRSTLGEAMGKTIRMSVAAILNSDGADEEYKVVVDLAKKARRVFEDKQQLDKLAVSQPWSSPGQTVSWASLNQSGEDFLGTLVPTPSSGPRPLGLASSDVTGSSMSPTNLRRLKPSGSSGFLSRSLADSEPSHVFAPRLRSDSNPDLPTSSSVASASVEPSPSIASPSASDAASLLFDDSASSRAASVPPVSAAPSNRTILISSPGLIAVLPSDSSGAPSSSLGHAPPGSVPIAPPPAVDAPSSSSSPAGGAAVPSVFADAAPPPAPGSRSPTRLVGSVSPRKRAQPTRLRFADDDGVQGLSSSNFGPPPPPPPPPPLLPQPTAPAGGSSVASSLSGHGAPSDVGARAAPPTVSARTPPSPPRVQAGGQYGRGGRMGPRSPSQQQQQQQQHPPLLQRSPSQEQHGQQHPHQSWTSTYAGPYRAPNAPAYVGGYYAPQPPPPLLPAPPAPVNAAPRGFHGPPPVSGGDYGGPPRSSYAPRGAPLSFAPVYAAADHRYASHFSSSQSSPQSQPQQYYGGPPPFQTLSPHHRGLRLDAPEFVPPAYLRP